MRSMFIGLVALAVASPVFAAPKSPKEKAIAAWTKLQTAGLHTEVLAQTKELNNQGYSKVVGSDAIVLGSGCGFAGCGYTFLVTTTFATQGSNTRADVLAGIVNASTYEEQGTVRRVVPRKELENLQN